MVARLIAQHFIPRVVVFNFERETSKFSTFKFCKLVFVASAFRNDLQVRLKRTHRRRTGAPPMVARFITQDFILCILVFNFECETLKFSTFLQTRFGASAFRNLQVRLKRPHRRRTGAPPMVARPISKQSIRCILVFNFERETSKFSTFFCKLVFCASAFR